MNERIKEFISKAQKEIWGNNPYNGSPEFEGYELDAEKFAELIVRECADWMENATVTDSAGNKDHIGDSTFWADELKEQFGVKE